MVACDTMTLLQLACLKHTGEYLPSNIGNSTAWSYTLKDGKKQGKFNPYADNLLTNPFRTLTDTHPIQQKIMRNLLHSELKQVFTFKVELEDIYAGMIGIDFRCLITPDEIQALCWARTAILNQSEYLLELSRDIQLWYIWLNERLNQREIADIANHPRQRKSFGCDWGKNFLIMSLSMLSYNPRIKSVLNKYFTDTPDKIEKLQKIVKGWARLDREYVSVANYKDWVIEREVSKWRNKHLPCGFVSGYGYKYPYCSHAGYRDSIDGTFNNSQTAYGIPQVKRDNWLYWFMWKIIYDKHTPEDIRFAHRKRTNAKVNFWEYIKKESGKYIPPDKSKHQERLVTSIIQQ